MLSRRSTRTRMRIPLAIGALALGSSTFAIAGAGCSKSADTTVATCASEANGLTCAAATCAAPGAATPGPMDTHCGAGSQPTSDQACHWDGGGADPGGASSSSSGAGGAAASSSGAGGGESSPYGPTEYGSEGDDDDCKYHVAWTSTPLCENGGVTFTVKATHKTDGTPLAGAMPYAEVFLDATHPSPNGPCACARSESSEATPGTYTLGPVFFDKPGNWTVRFHFNHECTDFSPESPHGHAAFYATVP